MVLASVATVGEENVVVLAIIGADTDLTRYGNDLVSSDIIGEGEKKDFS
jgi:hypothetical protein